jgi:hypothetical protein
MKYKNIREESLKSKVGKDWFSDFDTTEILGNIDFTVFPSQDVLFGRTPLLWAEAKTGNFDVSTMFSGSSINNADIGNWVDGAIVKTVGITDTVQYQSFAGRTFLSGYLFDGALITDIVNTVSTDKVLTTPGGAPVEFRFSNGQLNSNVSFMSVVTLNPGEKISLKFKTKDASTNSVLNQAQLLIQELIQN